MYMHICGWVNYRLAQTHWDGLKWYSSLSLASLHYVTWSAQVGHWILKFLSWQRPLRMLKDNTELVPFCWSFLASVVSACVNADDKNCRRNYKEMLIFQSCTKKSLFPFVALEFLSMKQHSNTGTHVHSSSFISASKCVVVAHFVKRGVKAAK